MDAATYKDKSGKSNRMFVMDRFSADVLVSGYVLKYRMLIVSRWHELEQAQRDFSWRMEDKTHQKHCMTVLKNCLPDDLEGENSNLPYIKANTTANKAISNYFGFPKALKKENMDAPMLQKRQEILDFTIKAYELCGYDYSVKELVYDKFKQPELTYENQY